MFALNAATRGRIALREIEAAVAEQLGPGRVSGNAQPAAFSRQVAMYLASHEGWSTTQIGKFYNGRDHSTVCYAIGRIRALRETDPEVDCLLSVLTNELRDRAPSKRKPTTQSDTVSPSQQVLPLLDEGVLDALAERIANKVLSKLTAPHLAAIAPAAALAPKVAAALGVARE
jgi:Bacterial dnaA protein helix-turn-helix